jgi:hypothetical protein
MQNCNLHCASSCKITVFRPFDFVHHKLLFRTPPDNFFVQGPVKLVQTDYKELA